MLPGPVFTFELMMSARRGRFYVTRAFYATVLLMILWTVHSGWVSWTASYEGGMLPISMIRWFGLSALGAIAVGQEILVLMLTPALVAGAIADEKRRKTLHYLLASRLTGPEIVLGKLMVRMLYVGVLLGVSFPVMSLLVLLGGIDPMLVLLCCAGLLSTAWFLAALSIWVSTIARRPREALFVTFGLEALWLIVPPVLRYKVSTGWGGVDDALRWIADWVGASSPVYGLWDILWALMAGLPIGAEQAFWMIGLQVAAGAVLAALAAVQLRPIFKRQDGAVARPRGLRAMLAARRLKWHRPLGDRPMIWKELHTGGAKGFARIVGWLLTLTLGGLVVYYSVRLGIDAFLEMRADGYGKPPSWSAGMGRISYQARWEFRYFLVVVVPLTYIVGILTLAGAAASSISSEHEDDTWVSLTATDLTGREIVLSKLLGSLWRARRLAALIGLMMIGGVVVGTLHYLSLAAMIVALVVYGWFAAALGMWISIQLRSTWRAQFLTISLLLLVNLIGQGVINMLSPRGYAPLVWPGFTPYEVSKLVMDIHIGQTFAQANWPSFWRLWEVNDGPGWLATFSVMSVVIYAAFGALLTFDALRRFENVAGRARRGAGDPDTTGVGEEREAAAEAVPVAVGSDAG